MMPIIVAFVVAWILDLPQYLITGRNYEKDFNGFGSINSVLSGTALAPMQYRIAIPLLYLPLRKLGVVGYEILKISVMALSLYSFWYMGELFWGQGYSCMMIYAILLLPQFQFDYAEQYLEVSSWIWFIIFMTQGNLVVVIVILTLAALVKETAIFIPLIYFLATMNIWETSMLLGVVLLVWLILRILFGWKENYLKRGVSYSVSGESFQGWNHSKRNLQKIMIGLKTGLHFSLYSLLYVGIATYSVFNNPFPVPLISLIVIPFVVLWFFRAMIHETRVGMPLLVFIVPVIMEILCV